MRKIPIISVSQQNRTTSESGKLIQHKSQSDRIGQDSTVIIFLEKKDDIIKLTLVKSRIVRMENHFHIELILIEEYSYIFPNQRKKSQHKKRRYKYLSRRYDMNTDGREVF